jgi:hypothetical protein
MKQSAWLGGLVLLFGGWVLKLSAQEGVWQPTVGSDPAVPTAGVSRPGPAATLGRPVALPADFTETESLPVPPPTTGVLPASHTVPPGSARLRNPELIASSVQGQAKAQPVARPEAVFAAGRGMPTAGQEVAGRSRVVRTAQIDNPYPMAPVLEPSADASILPGEPSVPPARFYLNAEYLLWWTKADQTPVLATTSANPNDFGFLGQPTTQILFGGGGLDRNPYHGARVTAGYYLDPCGQTAIEVGGFILGQESARFSVNSAETPVIARPFFNLNQNQEFSQLVAFPGVSTGNLQINAPSQLWGVEANLRCNLCTDCDYRIDGLVGFRYLDLKESITIQENIQGLDGAPAPFTNAATTVIDSFATRNQFYGGQFGLDADFRSGSWSLGLRSKLALGNTHQRLTIDGSETIVAPNGAVQNFVGGLLALPTNIGAYNRDRFSIVPEVGLNLGYQLSEHLRVSVGYNFLYWTNVLRPGNQIDRVLDVTQIPNFNTGGLPPTGQNRPAAPFKESDLWVHGLNVGFEFRY